MFLFVSGITFKTVEHDKGLRNLIKLKVGICICETNLKKEMMSVKKRKWNRKKRGLRTECRKCPCSWVEVCRGISERTKKE